MRMFKVDKYGSITFVKNCSCRCHDIHKKCSCDCDEKGLLEEYLIPKEVIIEWERRENK